MNGIILRTMITMLGLFLASSIVPGVEINGTGSFIFGAVLLGLINAFIRPIALLLTLPISLVTLGLFIFVVNAAMFGLVASILDGFMVGDFWSAVFGSIVVSITSTIASWTIGADGHYQVYVIRKD
jgi:putative membrane protein